jgi:serine/threonine-protein kinase
MSPHLADRNLLFGIIALQMDFISRDQLVAAMAAWVVDKHKSLGKVLCEQGALSVEDNEAIESLVRRHLLRHDDDPERSLASISSIGQRLRDDLAIIADPDLQASLPRIAAERCDTDSTISYVGSPTTSGGRFRILRPHARGGLGTVSVALDEELHREVALKEIQERYANEEQPRLRFQLEAEITGGLEHPGVVPVYGLGHHPDGRPFYAMRFVRGVSLKEAVAHFHSQSDGQCAGEGRQPVSQSGSRANDDDPFETKTPAPVTGRAVAPARSDGMARALAYDSSKSLEVRRLLSRFLDVCNAIAYAHSRGILHRDIKPGNILLGPYGETLVVDWGLAKIVGREEAAATDPGAEPTLRPPSASGTGETLPGTALGTPAYMSPEQAEGRLDLLGARADVYSLGATLYVVLTGRAPFCGADAADVLPKVQRGEFARPRAVNPSIPKPLEAICVKAMALKPADRYANPCTLAEDIEHWLADEPVSAYRGLWLDRARRWARKHRTLVTSAAAVLLLGLLGSVGFGAVVSAKNRELARQTQRAEKREQIAIDAVKRFRDVVVEEPVLKNNPALGELRKKLLKEPLEFFELLREQLQADEDTRAEALARLAHAAHDYAHLTQEIGDIQDGLRSHVESLAIWEKLVRDHPANADYRRGLARIEFCRGNMLAATGHPDQALESHGKALAIMERLARENPSVTAFQSALATNHNSIGIHKYNTGHRDQALVSFSKALEIRERLVRGNPSDIELQSNLASSYNNIGNFQSKTEHPEQALESYAKALAIWERLVRENASNTEFQSDVAKSHENMGLVQSKTGRPDQALESYRKALPIFERLARENSSVTEYQGRLAASHNSIGNLQSAMGLTEEALESYGKALAIQERLARENPSVTKLQSDLAFTYNSVGLLQRTMGHLEQASQLYGKALAIQERLARENPSVTEFQDDLARSHFNIGNLQRKTGHAEQALESYGKALAIRERLAREHPESPDYASDLGAALNNMALLDVDAKRFDQARDKLQQAISWQKKALAANPRHPSYRQFLGDHLRNLIRARKALGNEDEAKDAQRELDELAANDPAKAALDQRLAAVVRGEAPKDNHERLQLANRAYERRLYGASTRLYGEALEANSKLADDRQAQHRYNAACAAALATTAMTSPPPIDKDQSAFRAARGFGTRRTKRLSAAENDDNTNERGSLAPLTDADRTKIRDQALTWLEGELATWTKLLEPANAEQRRAIRDTLKHWQHDRDLASVRDEMALAKLPNGERKAWRSLWANVDALLTKASKP